MKTGTLVIAMFGILALSGCKSLCEQAAQKELQCLQGYCGSNADNPVCAQLGAIAQEVNQACDAGWAQDTMDMSCEQMGTIWTAAYMRNQAATLRPPPSTPAELPSGTATPEGTREIAPEGTGAVVPAETPAETPADEPSGEAPTAEPEGAAEEAPPTSE